MNNLISQEEINKINDTCTQYNIVNYTINNDGSIDVNGDVNLYEKELTAIPIKFNKVSGKFFCGGNKLTSLIGSPNEVLGDFFCNDNKLTSLMGCPTKVGGNFYCNDNQLTSLEGCPKEVSGYFSCSNNELTTLEGSPKEVGDNFWCNYNKLSSLAGLPKEMNNIISCAHNKIPATYYTLISSLQSEQKMIYFKYQSYYDVWTPEFNEENMNLLIDDIKDGLL